METPVKTVDLLGSADKAPTDIRFAAAVAAFGKSLKAALILVAILMKTSSPWHKTPKRQILFVTGLSFTQLVRLAQSVDVMPALETQAMKGLHKKH